MDYSNSKLLNKPGTFINVNKLNAYTNTRNIIHINENKKIQ